jgi:translation initiation factor 2B subunit (eIF-2B alpha/beta/delta family)
MATADLCLVGTDSVLFDGSIVNKIGTYPLAVTAREHSKPFYVVCEKSKLNLRSIFEPEFEIEEKDPSEVLPHPKKSLITVSNPYFDRTPGKFVSKLITEDGELSVEELPAVFRKMVAETYI